MEGYQSKVFKALSNGLRRNILLELLDRDLTPGYFAIAYEVSPQAITRHLKIMEQAHLIVRYRRGPEIYCQVNLWALKAVKVDWLIKLLL